MSQFRKHALAVASTSFVTLLTLGANTALAAAPALVTNNGDSGPGSLREALESGATQIRIERNVGTIRTDSALSYTGSAPLRIIGNGAKIRARGDFNVLELTDGASVRISDLTLRGTGGYSFEQGGIGKGLFIKVPVERTGIVQVDLTNVKVKGVANHGIHVSDCVLDGDDDNCGAGQDTEGEGSPASVNLIVRNLVVDDAGNGKFDADGIRVDERKDGGIYFQASSSLFRRIGADGVELDEAGNGDVNIDVRRTDFIDNGAYCLPSPLDLAEPCVEDDDGELVLDLDDGFDIDESDAGSIGGVIALATVRDNLDEGLDFDEAGDGGMDVDFLRVDGYENGDEAIKMSAADAGDVYAEIRGSVVIENSNDGVQLEAEDGDGEVHARVTASVIADNDDAGIKAEQENDLAPGSLRIRASIVDLVETENVIEE